MIYLAFALYLRSDVGGKLNYLIELTMAVENRVIRGFEINFSSLLVDTLKTVGNVISAIELLPKLTILMAISQCRLTKHAVVLAFDFLKAITHSV